MNTHLYRLWVRKALLKDSDDGVGLVVDDIRVGSVSTVSRRSTGTGSYCSEWSGILKLEGLNRLRPELVVEDTRGGGTGRKRPAAHPSLCGIQVDKQDSQVLSQFGKCFQVRAKSVLTSHRI